MNEISSSQKQSLHAQSNYNGWVSLIATMVVSALFLLLGGKILTWSVLCFINDPRSAIGLFVEVPAFIGLITIWVAGSLAIKATRKFNTSRGKTEPAP